MMPAATSEPTAEGLAATDDDAMPLAAVLARSFDTCPAWQWYLPPDSQNRFERMERFFRYLLTERLLRRHGFTVTEELRLPGGGPPVWRMWREPNNEQERA